MGKTKSNGGITKTSEGGCRLVDTREYIQDKFTSTGENRDKDSKYKDDEDDDD